MGFLWSNQ